MKLICVIGAPLLTLVEYVLIVIIAIMALGFAVGSGLVSEPPRTPLSWPWVILWLVCTVVFLSSWIANNYRRCRRYWQPEEEETDGRSSDR